MIPRITYASCYAYSPWGGGPVSERSRLLRSLLKAGDPRFVCKYAVRVRQQVQNDSPLANYIESSTVLVPIPGCTPKPGAGLAVAANLAAALLEVGLGRGIWMGLRRSSAVCKSATSAPGRRPSVTVHFDSFAIEALISPPARIVLVDDVVTKGRTLLAAASRLREAFPLTEIRAFAMLRTLGFVRDVNQLLDPCVGEIRWFDGDARRTP